MVGVPCPKAWTPLALLVSDSGSVQAHPFVCTVTIKVLTHLESLVGLAPTLFGIKYKLAIQLQWPIKPGWGRIGHTRTVAK